MAEKSNFLPVRLLRPRKVEFVGDDTPAKNIWGYTWRMTGGHQIALCLLAVAVAGLNLIPIELQRRIVDDAIMPAAMGLLVELAILYGVVLLSHQLAKFVMRAYQSWLSESTILRTRRHLTRLLRNGDVGSDEESGRAVSIIGSETDSLGVFVGEGPSQACVDIAKLLGVLGYMVVVEPSIALVAALFLIPQIAIVPVIQRHLNKLVEIRVKLMRETGDAITSKEIEEEQTRKRLFTGIYDNRIEFTIWKALMKGLINLINASAPLAVLIWGGWLVIQGETTLGVIVAFLSGFERVSEPVRGLLKFYRTVAEANVQHTMIARWMRG